MDLGKKIERPKQEEKEIWKPHPTNKDVLVNQHGKMKTRDFGFYPVSSPITK